MFWSPMTRMPPFTEHVSNSSELHTYSMKYRQLQEVEVVISPVLILPDIHKTSVISVLVKISATKQYFSERLNIWSWFDEELKK